MIERRDHGAPGCFGDMHHRCHEPDFRRRGGPPGGFGDRHRGGPPGGFGDRHCGGPPGGFGDRHCGGPPGRFGGRHHGCHHHERNFDDPRHFIGFPPHGGHRHGPHHHGPHHHGPFGRGPCKYLTFFI